MKIIAFPFAGGNKYSFPFLKQLSLNDIRLIVHEYPGRGQRVKEPLTADINLIAEDAFKKIIREIDASNYVIYGHSMGALIAYLICHKIEKLQLPPPKRLVVSGRCAPSIKKENRIHHLSGTLFWERVMQLGGVPKEIMQEQSLLNFFEPILKSDFSALDKYNHCCNSSLSVPIDVFYGNKEVTDVEDVLKWKYETTNEVNIFRLEGDHFFIFDHTEYLQDYFTRLYCHYIKSVIS